jgi:hypothetical protein
MILLVKLIGFVIQMIICPLVMLPWLLVRLIINIFPTSHEKQAAVDQNAIPVFGVSFS